MAFDGANIWVTNFGSDNVTWLSASDGTALGMFAIGTGPEGIAFDGANMWVANAGNNNVTSCAPAMAQISEYMRLEANPVRWRLMERTSG